MPSITQLSDSRAFIHSDPIRNFRFIVEFVPTGNANQTTENFYTDSAWISQTTLGFMSVSGLSVATEPIPYREGGDNTTPRKLPGQSNFSDITLTRGVVIGSYRNWRWLQRIFHAVQGQGSAAAGGEDAYFRWNIDIHVLHHPVNQASGANPAKVSFRVFNAWPSSLAYSDLDAGGNAVLIEQMTLTHEGWDMRWAANNKNGVSEIGAGAGNADSANMDFDSPALPGQR